jgi:hypothetical protein
MAELVNLEVADDTQFLPTVDLEFIREYVNGIPVPRLEAVAMTAWTAAKMGFSADAAHDLYVAACIMMRLADERVWDVGKPTLLCGLVS